MSTTEKKKAIKNSNIWRLNNTLLNNQQIMEEINPVCETAKETQMYRTDFLTLWERERGRGWDDLGEWY